MIQIGSADIRDEQPASEPDSYLSLYNAEAPGFLDPWKLP